MRPQRTWQRSFAATVSSLLLLSSTAYAEPKPKEEAPQATAVTHEGHSGVWFPLESAKRLRQLQTDYPYQVQRADYLKQVLDLRKKEIVKLRTVLVSERKILAERALQIRETEAQKQALEDRLTSVYRNPYLWFVAGLVVGGGTLFAVTR